MKISELSAATEVPVGTIKYYLREGLLHPGERTSRTTARYDHGHVERIRLVRALTDAGGLGIAQIKRVIDVIDADAPPRMDVLATAQDALVDGGASADGGASVDGEGRADREDPADGPPSNQAVLDGPPSDRAVLDGPPSDRARAWAERRGWFSYDGDQVIRRFARAWAACEDAGVDIDEAVMDQYADAVEAIARVDLAYVPVEADDAVRRVILGTVMIEPVLAALRLLAQRQVAITGEGAES